MPKKFQSEKERAKILDRIRKLQAVANNSSYPEEADTALRMAANYMKQYDLSLSDVELSEVLQSDICTEFVDRKVRSQETWERHLCMAVARLFDCKTYLSSRYIDDGTKEQTVMCFAGYKEDVSMCLCMFNQLLISSRAHVFKLYPLSMPKLRSFLAGFGVRMVQRVDEYIEENRKQEYTGRYDLVVRSKQDRIAESLEKKGLKFGKCAKRRRTIDADSFAEGERYADSTDLNRGNKLGGESGKKLLSM